MHTGSFLRVRMTVHVQLLLQNWDLGAHVCFPRPLLPSSSSYLALASQELTRCRPGWLLPCNDSFLHSA